MIFFDTTILSKTKKQQLLFLAKIFLTYKVRASYTFHLQREIYRQEMNCNHSFSTAPCNLENGISQIH